MFDTHRECSSSMVIRAIRTTRFRRCLDFLTLVWRLSAEYREFQHENMCPLLRMYRWNTSDNTENNKI